MNTCVGVLLAENGLLSLDDWFELDRTKNK